MGADGIGAAVRIETDDESVLLDFPEREVRADDGREVDFRFTIPRLLLDHLVRTRTDDWVNSLFLSLRFSAWRRGAYNDYLSEWCTTHRKRLFGIGLIPCDDVKEAVAELKHIAKLPNIIGVKEATGDVNRFVKHRRLIGPQFNQLSGDDGLALAQMAVGGDGCISVTGNIAPRQVEDARHMCPVDPLESRRIPVGRKDDVVHRHLIGWRRGGKGWNTGKGGVTLSRNDVRRGALGALLGLREIDLRGDLRRFRGLEERVIALEAEDRRRDVRRELATRGVVLLHLLVVAHPLDCDTVFCAGQLIHQAVEGFIRAQFGVVLHDHQESRQGGALFVGGLHGLLRRPSACEFRS